MLKQLFESELTRALKKSEQKEKTDDIDRKEGDDEKIDNDLKAKELDKKTNAEPNPIKKRTPSEMEIMAMQAGAEAEAMDAETANVEQDTENDGGEEAPPKEAPAEEDEEECEDGDEECEKKKKEKEDEEDAKNESIKYNNIFKNALFEFSMMQKLKATKDSITGKHQGNTFRIHGEHKKTGQILYIDKYDGRRFTFDKKSQNYIEILDKELKDYKIIPGT